MPKKTSKNRLRENLFFESLKLLKKRPKNIFFILLFDALFLVILTAAGGLMQRYIPQGYNEASSVIMQGGAGVWLLLITPIIYLLFIIAVHSILKLAILKIIASYDNKKLGFNLKKFFLLNIAIFLILTIVFTVVSGIFSVIFNPDFLKWMLFLFVAVHSILSYTYINFSHSLFIKEKGIKKILKKSCLITFTGIRKYYGTLVWVIALLAAYILLSLIAGNIAKIADVGQERYSIIYTTITSALLYAAVFINRMYFYLISKKC